MPNRVPRSDAEQAPFRRPVSRMFIAHHPVAGGASKVFESGGTSLRDVRHINVRRSPGVSARSHLGPVPFVLVFLGYGVSPLDGTVAGAGVAVAAAASVLSYVFERQWEHPPCSQASGRNTNRRECG